RADAVLAEFVEHLGHRVDVAGDHFGPGLVGVLVERLVAVAADYGDDGLVGADLAFVGKSGRAGDRGATGGLGEDALGGAEQVDRLKDLLIAGGGGGAAARHHGVDDERAVAGGADRDRVRRGVGRLRLDLTAAVVDRRGDRAAALGLGDVDLRPRGLRQADDLELAQSLVHARGERSPRRRADDVV